MSVASLNSNNVISKTKIFVTGIDVRQVVKWIVFIFIYKYISVYMADNMDH